MSVPIFAPAIADNTEEHDSACEDSSSSIATLESKYYDYVIENNRRYHAHIPGCNYWAPNDERQSEQLDYFHHLCYILLDQKLILAPIRPDPQEVLDLGTGTGIWAMDFADKYPSAKVIGTDISPGQPIPPNLQFEINDFNKPWSYKSDSYDLINIRTLSGSVQDWPRLYQDIFNSVKPGGWINQLEASNQLCSKVRPLPDDHVLSRWSSQLIKAGEQNGKTMKIEELAKEYIENAGFINVVERSYQVPLGVWPNEQKEKDLGMLNLKQFETGLEGFTLRLLTQVMGWRNL